MGKPYSATYTEHDNEKIDPVVYSGVPPIENG